MNDTASIVQSQDSSARLCGALTFKTVPQLYEQLIDLNEGIVQVDLSEVTVIDSAGLSLLLEWAARLRPDGARLQVNNAPGNLIDLAELCNAEDWLDLMGRDQG